MFEVGTYVVYGLKGVCKIEEITTLKMGDIPKDRLFYVLSACANSGSRIYTPVEHSEGVSGTVMRAVMTKKEAEALIEEMPDIEELWIENEKQREELFRDTMKTGDCKKWIQVMKTLYLRRKKRLDQGKKTVVSDEKYFRMVQDLLLSELSISLCMEKNEVDRYLLSKMQETTERSVCLS